MTRGIRSRESYYYKRLYVDAVRAVSAAKQLPNVDPDRVGVHGASQGGGIALAVAALRHDVNALAAFVPFLCDFPRRSRSQTRTPNERSVSTSRCIAGTSIMSTERCAISTGWVSHVAPLPPPHSQRA